MKMKIEDIFSNHSEDPLGLAVLNLAEACQKSQQPLDVKELLNNLEKIELTTSSLKHEIKNLMEQ